MYFKLKQMDIDLKRININKIKLEKRKGKLCKEISNIIKIKT